MVCSFLVPVVGNYNTLLTLPPCYNILSQKHNFPTSLAFLFQIGGDGWLVDIVKDSNMCSFTGGWKNAATALNIKVGDLIIFKFIDGVDFQIDIIRKDVVQQPSNIFHISFTTQTECMISTSEHFKNHLQNNNLHKPFTIRFGTGKWLVDVKRSFTDLYITDGWKKLFEDLNLQIGVSSVFRKLKQTTFTVDLFLQDGTGVQPNDNDSNIQDEIIYIYSDESDADDDFPTDNPAVEQHHFTVEEYDDAIEQHHPPVHLNESDNAGNLLDDHIPVNHPPVAPHDPAVEENYDAVFLNEATNAADLTLDTADDHPTVVKQLTHKFADFVNGAELQIKFGDGNIIKEKIRAE
ncbi:hypothetical protein M8C21_023799, partial [Ambrosia artemisiifolia]